MVLRFDGTRRPGLDCDAVGTGACWNEGCCCCCCVPAGGGTCLGSMVADVVAEW